MDSHTPIKQTRRAFLRACLSMTATFVLAACGRQVASGVAEVSTTPEPTGAPPAEPSAAATAVPATAPAQPPATEPQTTSSPQTTPASTQIAEALSPTPACEDDDDVTPAQTEGPYYTPDTPERTSLIEPGITGTKLAVTGYVLTTDCQPVARALVDFWQCDDNGVYDNAGYRLRGHQFTDDQGRYILETIVPGLYPGRTRHIHVKVQAPNQPILTTQLYFSGEQSNDSDRIFHPDLMMDVQEATDGQAASFNFVLNIT